MRGDGETGYVQSSILCKKQTDRTRQRRPCTLGLQKRPETGVGQGAYCLEGVSLAADKVEEAEEEEAEENEYKEDQVIGRTKERENR